MQGFEFLGLSLLALGAGASFVVQQAVNSGLRSDLHSATWAGFVSYLGGTLCMLMLAIVFREAPPSTGAIAGSSWWGWTGGFFGAIYIAISILLLPRLGAATFLALLVSGQMLASVFFDNYGLLGIPEHPANATRLLGAAMLIVGVTLIRL